MYLNIKLFFRYTLLNFPFSFINNLEQKSKNVNLSINNDSFFYLCTHLKLSSVFYSSHLSDIFAYELPNNSFYSDKNESLRYNTFLSKNQSTVMVYNFHLLYSQDRVFIFVNNDLLLTKSKILSSNPFIDSIAEIFPAANWLEREAAELHGVTFTGKKDLRNLMLQYGDTSAPFQKSFPTIGLNELYYDPIKDTLVQNPVSVQL
jgi:NADH:ubiquinone oxidoreductase subunit C